jgi:hypothetical protein
MGRAVEETSLVAVISGRRVKVGPSVVQFRFSAEEWAQMTPKQRIDRCTTLAEEAQKLADKADGKFRPLYLELKVQWLTLGDEMRKANGFSQPTVEQPVSGRPLP